MKYNFKYSLLLLFIFISQQTCFAQTIISSNTTINQSWIDNHVNNLPIVLNDNVTITIEENLVFSNANLYFAILGTGVIIDGNGKTITLSNLTNYLGLVNNGNYLGQNLSAYANSIVKNIGVISNNSTLKEYSGWIGQWAYGNGAGFSITNCYSTGNMTSYGSGGILGYAYMNGTISNCYSLGDISGNYCAGILAISNYEAIKIINCYSNGSITGSNANGICNPNMMDGDSFTNCYATNGSFNSTTANSKLIGTDGSVWNTSIVPYTLVGFTSSTIPASISNFASISKYYFDGTHTITPPTSDSSGAFTYTSSNTNVATISGTTVTIVGAGTATITATQAADSTYSSTSITANLTVTSPTVVTKQGQFTSTDANYVNKYGALASNTGLSEKGEITKTKSFTTVTHGLVLNLDASNASSYSGTGTSWTDLSGSSNNMSLYNGASYDPSNQNSILFDGVNDYVGKNTAINTGQDFTVSVWMYATLLGTTRTSLVANSYDYTGGNGWFFCTDALGAPNSFFLSIGSDNPVKVSSDNSISINTWNYLTAVVKSGGRYIDLYKNGILISGATTDSGVSTISYNYDNFSIGLRDPAGTPDPFEGNIGTTHIYNLALTAEEVLQNFNATKERYGL